MTYYFVRSIGSICTIVALSILFVGCSSRNEKNDSLFLSLTDERTGIDFENSLNFDNEFNIYTYRNYYNGGGVAIGDINNDGLLDIYFTGNMVPNRLYLNQGNFKFKDITGTAGVEGKGKWSTGVSMADVNGDGLTDIYVCNSGDIRGDAKQNELFINNGDLTFTERAKEYGVDDRGYTTHAAFFDYDKDGDLDLYILNNSYTPIGSFNLRKNERHKRDSLGGDKFLRNDNGKYHDVSDEVGVYGSLIGFGLGVTVGDVNRDGWMDIYVSNDFFERDYLYINTADGKFKEVLPESMRSISAASMGADVADINNDGYPDIFVTDMLPGNNSRLKTVTTFDNWDRYQYNVENGYFHQFTRNMLQLNNGDGTFSEIGRLSGVEATDWSWGALVFDMDNDGLKDIFVCNGILRDLTNQDYLQYVSNPDIAKTLVNGNKVDYKTLVELIPSNPISNYAFRNMGNLKFSNVAKDWGLDAPAFSNGAAYGDLDNDGDMDLVVNHVNGKAGVFQNETQKNFPSHHYLKFDLTGSLGNTAAVGTSISIEAKGKIYYIEQMPIRGFQSSVDDRPNIGVGDADTVERVTVRWPGGTITRLDNVPTNQVLHLSEAKGVAADLPNPVSAAHSNTVLKKSADLIPFTHVENSFVDFDRDKLIYHMLSNEGPRMTQGDVNRDGLTDIYIGGAKDQSGQLFIQQKNGQFILSKQAAFEQDKGCEDMGSAMFDADGDGDDDIYVCSGGSEFSNVSTALIDRLYLNNGKGEFTRANQTLPSAAFESKSTVKPCDYDNDGDVDLFVGVRFVSSYYGVPSNGYILNNDGKGKFTEVSASAAPGLRGVGMITDAIWSDVNHDGQQDLVVVGEFMAVKVFLNQQGKLAESPDKSGLARSNGWWNRIEAGDLDKDGDIDFVVGNHGYNSRFRASYSHPVEMYISDFDQNGTTEQIMSTFIGDSSYPMPLRHDLISQMPILKKKYLKYESYKNQTVSDVFGPENLGKALRVSAYEFATSVLLNNGSGEFTIHPLPVEAQLAPVFGIEIADYDKDGISDLLLGGNQYRSKPEVGRYDASYGLILMGNGDGTFRALSAKESGVNIDGEVRDVITVQTPRGPVTVISRNDRSVVTLEQ
ncbi:VCBS repeat-containing protein [Chryseolinea sp. T2]|uniref:VCBS repeat-containing protein n=1 Tax=Chryseolinea sp. T2 TaxID=3129255 RepID=UPI003077AA85